MPTVLFDIDHTLAFDNKLELKVLEAMVHEMAPPSEQIDKIIEIASHQFERVRIGQVGIAEALTELFGQLATGADARQLAATYIERVVGQCHQYLRVSPGARQVLGDLQGQGVQVGILSNGWTRLQEEKIRLIGFEGPLFVSEAIGYWKPDVRAFDFVLQQLGADRGATWFVGDSPTSDIQGAKSAGLRAAWVNWEGQTYPPGLPPPDREVRRLEDVLEAVR
ncbi:MAG TPA: HAD family hydrolase [Candidatus Xenobia bacterium]|jgi:HAD superfamily hydrolase (TIGR01509 family)